jgi:hypothetical protein
MADIEIGGNALDGWLSQNRIENRLPILMIKK